MSAKQLAYFTEVDHHNHEALAAVDPASHNGLGVARYVRSRDDPDEAEFAVAVADDLQGLGLGTALVRELATRARDEGIAWFTGLLLGENQEQRLSLLPLFPLPRR